MKFRLPAILSFIICATLQSQTVVVNPDGTHTTVINNGTTSIAVLPDGTHATTVTTGNIVTIINPDGTHSVGTVQTAVEATKSGNSGKNAHMDSLYFVWESGLTPYFLDSFN